MDYIVHAKDVTKIYKVGDHEVIAIDHMSFDIKKGEFVVILDPFGAEKAILLNLLEDGYTNQ